ncbi:hypothetical protein ACFSL4_01735 [Streptomyces caeni]|uniref:DUF3040 domain-containing protein n=1 Tax=Streptomyces caeni TaxID=2307231 RepID=A0ABW4II36_9ACTN
MSKQQPGRRSEGSQTARIRQVTARLGRFWATRLARARAGAWAGGGLVSAGVGLQWGLPLALIVSGALLTAYCLLVADIAEPDRGDRRPQTW